MTKSLLLSFLFLLSCGDAPSIVVPMEEVSHLDEFNQNITFSAVPPFSVERLPQFNTSYVLYGSMKINGGTEAVHFSLELENYTLRIVVDENQNGSLADDSVKTLAEAPRASGALACGLSYELGVQIKHGNFSATAKFWNVRHGKRQAKLQTTSFTAVDRNMDGAFNSTGDVLLIDRPFQATMTLRLDGTKENRLYLWGGEYIVRVNKSGESVDFQLIPPAE